jgi:tetratricopeptide (TPR) repeat protein
LAEEVPTAPEYRSELAGSLNNLGLLLKAADHPADAEKSYREAIAIEKELVASFPGVPGYRDELGGSYHRLAIVLRDTGRPEKGEQAYRSAVAIQEQLASEFPDVTLYRANLASTMVNLAIHLHERGANAEARKVLEAARPHHQAALAGNPRDRFARHFYRNNIWRLAQILLEDRDHTGAAVLARELPGIAFDPAFDAYEAACVLARCLTLAEKDPRLGPRERRDKAHSYGDRAVAELRHAIESGYQNISAWQTDARLASLRPRSDFQKLLTEGSRAPEKPR